MNTALEKQAYSVNEFCRAFSIGRTYFYSEVKNQRLKINKLGTKTLVTADNAKAWLDSLPEVTQ